MNGKTLLLATGMLLAAGLPAAAETIPITIGHQSMCTDTYTGGIVIKELGLLEKYLPKDGRYKDATYEISWSDYSSGGCQRRRNLGATGRANIPH